MPIPKPKLGESRQQFLDRCMGDDTMTTEYDSEQRLAVCTTEYDSKEDSNENDHKEQIRRDVFTTEEEAEARAEAIGCSGTHSHTEDGQTIFMPCSSHDDYVERVGRDVAGYKKPKKPKKKEEDCGCDNSMNNIEDLKSFIDIKTELKAYEDEEDLEKATGEFEGYGSVFNNTDLGNDVIRNGAFKKSLSRRGAKGVKLLYQHKSDMPIGVFESIKEDQHGLKVKGRLAMKTQAGQEAYELMKMGALDGLSIGFRVNPKKVSYDKRTKKRIIDEVDLMEISLVTFPMNPQATVRSVKGEEISIREWENGMRDAFHLSRSEAKQAAKAVHEVFTQRDVEDNTELVDAIKQLTKTLKQA